MGTALYRPFLNGNEKKYVNDCLDTSWISSLGKYVNIFENNFADFIGSKGAIGVSNGTVALHVALETLGIGPGDEVIVPTFTYIASVNAIAQTGATPVFVDSDINTWQMCPKTIEAKITSKTKAVMVVHLYGHPCDMDELVKICKRNNVKMIEDCAEAFGSYYAGSHVGTFGDCATFSFFGNKTITTGEGGMVVSNNEEFLAKCRLLKGQGMSPSKLYWHECLGYNYRMTNIQAAIGVAQLEQAKEIISKKRKIAFKYAEKIKQKKLPLIMLLEHDTKSINSFWMCTASLDEKFDRDTFMQNLRDRYEIETRPAFYLAHTMPMYEKLPSAQTTFSLAEKLSRTGLNLPSYPDLTDDNIEYIINSIKEILSSNK